MRVVLMWGLALSALAARTTFSHAPVPVTGPYPVLHAAMLIALLVALWRRWLSTSTATLLATVPVLTGTTMTLALTSAGVAAGEITPEAVGNVALPGLVALVGIAFVGLRRRTAMWVSAIGLVVQTTTIAVAGGGLAAIETRPVLVSLRFGIVAIVLFAVVASIADRRGAERDQASKDEARAEQRAADLEAAAQVRATIASRAAHELKTPIAVMRAAMETIRDHGDVLDEAQLEEYRDVVWRMLQRLEARAGAVLATSTAPPTEVTFPVRQAQLLLDDAVAAVSHALAADDITLQVVSEDAPVRVDATAFEHVIENLLSNAGKYAPPGTTVRVTSEVEDGHVVVRVHDEGSTLSPADAARVFEAGFRAPSAAASSGTGIGLSLVRDTVEQWGGRVWCAVGDGTTFGFTIPVVASPAPRLAPG